MEQTTPASPFARIADFFRGKNGQRLILILGFAGIGLILLSTLWPDGEQADSANAGVSAVTPEAYAQKLEAQLTEIVSSIEGVGECRIMVTLENGTEYVYENKTQLVTEILPTVKGVVIVCAGGDDQAVRERVQSAVTTALNITARRVCVTKLT